MTRDAQEAILQFYGIFPLDTRVEPSPMKPFLGPVHRKLVL